jgi:uroporphyrinogen-III synthase
MSSITKTPLSGRRVVVTRARDQAPSLSERLEALGADVIELPVIRITREISKEALADVMLEFASYDWLVFTSANGVRFFFEEFFRLFDDIRSLGFIRIACVGDGTSRELTSGLHLKVECQPVRATAEALAEALIGTDSLDNAKVLVITGNLNRDTLVRKLEGARAIVDCLQVYKTESANPSGTAAAADFCRRGADAILFTSSSSAEAFAGQPDSLAIGPGARRPLAGSIGPQTSAAMRKCGISVDFEAEKPGLDGLLEALVSKIGAQ